jgi:serine/threonine protein kinase
MSPERVDGSTSHHGSLDDMWALGMIILEVVLCQTSTQLFTGLRPPCDNRRNIDKHVAAVRAKDGLLGEIAAHLLHEDLDQRWSAAEVIRRL